MTNISGLWTTCDRGRGCSAAAAQLLGVACPCILLTAVLAGGCATGTLRQHDATLHQAWHLHRDRIAEIRQWQMQATVKLSHETKRWGFKLRWQCSRARYRLDLYAPSGQQLLQFTGNSGGAQAKDSKGQVFHSDDAEALAEEMLGVAVPISSLCVWLLGIPDENYSDRRIDLDTQGRLLSLFQRDWDLSYLDYRNYQDQGAYLPAAITLTQGNVKIQVNVSRWSDARGTE